MMEKDDNGDGKEVLMMQSLSLHASAWVSMAADKCGSLVFIRDVTADRSAVAGHV